MKTTEIVMLDGTVVRVKHRRVRRRVIKLAKSNTNRTNSPGEHIEVHTDEGEWAAWEQLPRLIQQCLDGYPIEQSVEATLAEWQKARAMGATPERFVAYMNKVGLMYLNATADCWPVQPPPLRELPRWP